MNKNKFWLIFALVFLVSCQSSRFMQDDMYFNETDAIREVREYENARLFSKFNKNEVADSDMPEEVEANEDYYDYSYTSRLRRFNTEDNTWGYYDPYYTNYYWYNNSSAGYFGNSVYSTYTWWGPNFSGNYNSHYGEPIHQVNTKGWINPWKLSRNGGKNPYNRYAFNGWNNGRLNNSNLWNTGLGYTNMYYNSFDNNCYSWYRKTTHNFAALMQKNGIQKDVSQRPEINYTAIRETKLATVNKTDSTSIINETNTVLDDTREVKTNTNTVVSNNENTSKSSTTNTTVKNNSTNNTNTTTKRWDNNADLNITPNTTKTDNNTSRSGVYSEGSRNNNYVYKGSAIPNKGSIQNKGKDPK